MRSRRSVRSLVHTWTPSMVHIRTQEYSNGGGPPSTVRAAKMFVQVDRSSRQYAWKNPIIKYRVSGLQNPTTCSVWFNTFLWIYLFHRERHQNKTVKFRYEPAPPECNANCTVWLWVDWKCRTWKMTDQIAGLENEGPWNWRIEIQCTRSNVSIILFENADIKSNVY